MSFHEKIALYTVDRYYDGSRSAQDVVSALISVHN